MHIILERYFALADAVNECMDPSLAHESARFGESIYCMTCFGDEGWQDKLSGLLVQHGISLKRFANESFPQIGLHVFMLDEDGKLRLVDNSLCIDVKRILRVAARLLPQD